MIKKALKIALLSTLIITLHAIENKPADYRHIIFDFGGVLLDGSPEHNGHIAKAEPWRQWNKGELTQEAMIQKLSLLFNPDDVAQIVAATRSANRPWIEETITIISKLKQAGYRIYLLSNLSREIHDLFIMNNPLFEQFDGILCSYQVGCVKPGAEIYQILLDRYGLNAQDSIFIDDLQNNTEAAEKLGIKSILYTKGTLAKSLADAGIAL